MNTKQLVYFRLVLTILANITFLNLVFPAYAESLEIKLRKNMPYRDAKTLLVNSGWQHAGLPAYSYRKSDQKVISDCFGEVKICNEYPEMQNCSGQGYCKMLFYDHFGNNLSVTTYGPLVSERLHVIGWSLDKKEK